MGFNGLKTLNEFDWRRERKKKQWLEGEVEEGGVDNLSGIQQHCAITVRVTCNNVIQENGIQAAQGRMTFQ